MKYNELTSAIETCPKHPEWRSFFPCPICSEDRRNLIEVGPFEIIQNGDGYWIRHESGEGMGVSKEALLKLINDFYDKNF